MACGSLGDGTGGLVGSGRRRAAVQGAAVGVSGQPAGRGRTEHGRGWVRLVAARRPSQSGAGPGPLHGRRATGPGDARSRAGKV
eukprot:6320146-Prymnesium_polylepis.1